MKTKAIISMLALTAGLLSAAQAQMIGGLAVSPATVKAGEPVTVTATVDVANGNYCGFAVFYGDGKTADNYSDANHSGPFVSTHVYDKPGTYTLSMGGRHVESHPNCGGGDKFATVTVTPGDKAAGGMAKPASTAKATAATVCPAGWTVVAKSFNAKTGAYTCSAKAGTALPASRAQCPGDLTYFENAKKAQFGCRP
jgi:hypothetical protein